MQMHIYMNMPKLCTIILLLVCCSCAAPSPEAERTSQESNGLVGRLDNDGSLGNPRVSVFAGNINSGRYCVLTIYNNEFSGDGFYTIQLLDSTATVEIKHGKRFTLRGRNDTTIWQCAQDNQSSYYFLTSGKDVIYHVPDDNSSTTQWPLRLLHQAVIGQ